MMRGRRHSAGFSLVELMLALTVMAVVTTRVFSAFTDQHQNSLDQERVLDTQQGMRLVMDVILKDLRLAGFMVQRETGVGSVDGGTGGPDMLCMSDPDSLAAARYANATQRFDSATITSVLTGSNSSINLWASTMDIDGDGDVDFVEDGGMLISDGNKVHCARITGVSGNTVTITPATPSGMTFAPSSARAVPAIVYQLSGATLTRNDMVVSTEVDDLQVEFGVDTNRDGEIGTGEFPIHDLTGSNTDRIRVARVHLTTRTAVADADFSGTRPAAANRVAASSSDNFRRRKAVADAHLRNLR